MQVSPLAHCLQVAPLSPQALLVGGLTQAPLESQQPSLQEVASHLLPEQTPAWHFCSLEQMRQVSPPYPQASLEVPATQDVPAAVTLQHPLQEDELHPEEMSGLVVLQSGYWNRS